MSVNNIKDAVASCPACEESAYSDPLSFLNATIQTCAYLSSVIVSHNSDVRK